MVKMEETDIMLMPIKELNKIFRRFNQIVPVKGVLQTERIEGTRIIDEDKSVKELNNRTIEKERFMRKKASEAETREEAMMWIGSANRLRTLRRAGIATRIVQEAVDRPNGMIGLSVRYGRKRADEILRARALGRLSGKVKVVGGRR